MKADRNGDPILYRHGSQTAANTGITCGLVKTQTLGSTCRVLVNLSLWGGAENLYLKQVLGDADTAGLGTIF